MIGCTCSRCQDEWRVVRDPSATEEPRPPRQMVVRPPEPVGERRHRLSPTRRQASTAGVSKRAMSSGGGPASSEPPPATTTTASAEDAPAIISIASAAGATTTESPTPTREEPCQPPRARPFYGLQELQVRILAVERQYVTLASVSRSMRPRRLGSRVGGGWSRARLPRVPASHSRCVR